MTDEKHSTRLVIVSDQPIYLLGLETLVIALPGVRLVGEAKNGGEAIQVCSLASPDMILMDLHRDASEGRVIAREIHRILPAMKMALLLRPQDVRRLTAELALPLYFLSRDLSGDEFKAAFEQVRAGSPRRVFGLDVEPGDMPSEVAGEPPGDVPADPSPIQYRNQETLTRELTMAGKIQSSFLPEEPPAIPGWDITARLEPARETSGDFYDFIPLTDRKWGIVVADVTDKGVAAALFMALSSTLIRTFTSRFPTLPGLALKAVSDRILSDTGGSMFVTALFGILEPHSGRFIYANAGHPPGYLVSGQRGRRTIETLRSTGMALGVIEQAQWKQKVVKLGPGDVLVLYSDGVIEAEDAQGESFGDERLLDVVLANSGCSSREIQEALLNEVHRFSGNALRQDDIALIVIKRDGS